MTKTLCEKGFSLLELSMGLVIISLVAGGVMAGVSLKKSAELNTVITEAKNDIVAINHFQTQYNGLPGDIVNATSFWGAADPVAVTCNTIDKTGGTATCNGSGNGMIDANTQEMYLAWQHLDNAGLIDGQYSGMQYTAGIYDHKLGWNCPLSKYKVRSGWGIRFWPQQITGAGSNNFLGSYGTALMFGQEQSNSMPMKPVLTPQDMYNIDKKMDDGMPATGDVVVRSGTFAGGTTCTIKNGATTVYTDLDAQYNLSFTQLACAPLFRNIVQ